VVRRASVEAPLNCVFTNCRNDINHPANTRTTRYKVEQMKRKIAMPATNARIISIYIAVRFEPSPLNVSDALPPDKRTLASKAFDSDQRRRRFVRKLA